MKKLVISSLIAVPMFFSIACGSAEDSSDLQSAHKGIVVRSVAGENAESILDAVNQYRKDLGDPNNAAAPGPLASGRREINWDGVPARISSPNNFPGDTFRNRGLLISVPGNKLQVSTNTAEQAQAQPLFGNLNANFPHIFAAFSPEKLFAPVSSTETVMTFVVPGTDQKALVSGFGAVFTDVDLANVSKIEYYDIHNKLLHREWVKAVLWKNKSLSFVGVTFKDKVVASVKITSGNIKLGQWKKEDKWNDAVALDDFLYGEPKAVAQW